MEARNTIFSWKMVRETKYGSYIILQVHKAPEVTQKPLTNGGQKELKTAPKRDFRHLPATVFPPDCAPGVYATGPGRAKYVILTS